MILWNSVVNLEPLWGRFGVTLGYFGFTLGHFGATLGPLWGTLGYFGFTLGHFGGTLDHFGVTLEPQKTPLEALGPHSGPTAAPREVAHTPKSPKCSK